MAKKPQNLRKTTITSMRLSASVLKAATGKAAKLGVSRTHYVEQLLRRDLKMEAVDDVNVAEPSVFG